MKTIKPDRETIIRTARPDERQKCVDFANLVFSHSNGPHDFETLIPKVYSTDERYSQVTHYLVVDDPDYTSAEPAPESTPAATPAPAPTSEIRALVALNRQTLHVGGDTMVAGFVGTVSVHPKYRGRAYMQKLLAYLIEDTKTTCDFLVLGGQRQRYEHFGFTQGSLGMQLCITRNNFRHDAKLNAKNDAKYKFIDPTDLASVNPTSVDHTSLDLTSVDHTSVDLPSADFSKFADKLNSARPYYVERNCDMEVFKTFKQKILAIVEDNNSDTIAADNNSATITADNNSANLVGYIIAAQEAPNEVSELALADYSHTGRVIRDYLFTTEDLNHINLQVPIFMTEELKQAAAWSEWAVARTTGGLMFRINNYEKYISLMMKLKTDLVLSPIPDGEVQFIVSEQPKAQSQAQSQAQSHAQSHAQNKEQIDLASSESITIRVENGIPQVTCVPAVKAEPQAPANAHNHAQSQAILVTRQEFQKLLFSILGTAGIPGEGVLDTKAAASQIPQGWFPLWSYWYTVDEF